MIHFWTAGEKRLAAIAIVLGVLFVVHLLVPENWVAVFAVSATVPYWSVLAVPLLFYAATTRVHRFVLYGLAVLAGFHVYAVWYPWFGNYPDAGVRSARIAAANLYVANRSPRAMTAELGALDADVLILQEVDERWFEKLQEAAWYRDYPFRHHARRDDAYGMLVLSRLPLLEPETLTVAEVPQLAFQIEAEDRRIRVLGLHLKPPVTTENIADQQRMVRGLRSWIEQPGLPPVLVVGDANLTPWNSLYGDLAAAPLMDVAPRIGDFWWPTWSPKSLIPGFDFHVMPVDHAFASELIRVHRVVHTTGHGSDHRPLVVDASW